MLYRYVYLWTILLSSSLVAQAGPAVGPVVWDNGPIVTHPGGGFSGADASSLENATLGLTIYGFGVQKTAATDNSLCDNFCWAGGSIDKIRVYGYQTNGGIPSTINACYMQIWDADPTTAAAAVVWGDMVTNQMTSSQWSNAYRTLESTVATASNRAIMEVDVDVSGSPIALSPGTYYLQWQLAGSASSGPWNPPVSILGQATTGDALQYIGNTTTWQPVLSGGNAQALPFTLWGTAPMGSENVYGVAKPGTSGPCVWATGTPPVICQPYELKLTNGHNGSAPAVLIGIGRANTALPFGTFLVNSLMSVTMPAFAAGESTTVIMIPPVPLGPVNFQAWYLDPGAGSGVAHSDGLELTTGNGG